MLVFIHIAIPLLAQGVNDTIQLEAVTIYGIPLPNYAVGSKMQEVDSVQKMEYAANTLAQLLQEQTPIYIKEYGSGQLATISFRGTGASHTKVLWNGLSINSPTLGQSDFSTLPVFALDNIAVQYGGASALYGSDALGGTILLGNNTLQFSRKKSAILQQSVGSFGKLFSGVSAKYGNQKAVAQTKVYRSSQGNSFKYRDNQKVSTQNHTATLNYGLMQQIGYKFSEGKQLVFNGWYAFNFRELQPAISAQSDDVLQDENIRLSLDYYSHSKFGFFNLKAGYVSDNELYNESSSIKATQFVGRINYDKKINKKASIKIGGNWNTTTADVHSYQSKTSENSADVFALIKYKITEPLLLSINLRKSFHSSFKSLFTPAIGISWRAAKSIQLKGQFSRNYRVPTFNDRYWVPGGNPDLKPEDGVSGEIGVLYKQCGSNWSWEAEFTHYRMLTNDWIVWVPHTAGLWLPNNIRKVKSNGIEVVTKATMRFQNFRWTLGGNYAYTKSTILQDERTIANVGNQLAYTPFHQFIVYQKLKYKTWRWSINANYTGARYTNLSNANDRFGLLPSNILLNASLGKTITFKKTVLDISFDFKNILNTSYQNLLNRAMPIRNYNIGIRYHLNFNN